MAQVKILYIATERGVVQLANPGTSDRWRMVGAGLTDQSVLAVSASASEPLQAFAGTAVGLYATANGGMTWDMVQSVHVTSLAATPDAVYVGTAEGTILRGVADDWVAVAGGTPPVRRLGVLRDGRVGAVYGDGAVALLDGDVSTPLDVPIPDPLAVVGGVANPGDLFVVARTGVAAPGGFQPVDGVATGAAVLMAGRPEVLLLGMEQSVLRSEDGGTSFFPVDGPVDLRVLVSPPRLEDYAYAGTGAGELWLSSDRGRTWRRLHAGMPPVHDLSFARVF